MKKLINGIVDFRKTAQQGYREAFGKLATGQSPDALFIACSDSRVVPNTFASTNPGDLFVIRNVGNLVPMCGASGLSKSDESEAAAIEFAILNLNVNDIVVCGHSECGAMRAILDNRKNVPHPNLKSWLRHGDNAMKSLLSGQALDPDLEKHNQLSQLNVLSQIENIKSYPAVAEKLKKGELNIHAWWFDISHADVYAYDQDVHRFVIIDEEQSKKILKQLKK